MPNSPSRWFRKLLRVMGTEVSILAFLAVLDLGIVVLTDILHPSLFVRLFWLGCDIILWFFFGAAFQTAWDTDTMQQDLLRKKTYPWR